MIKNDKFLLSFDYFDLSLSNFKNEILIEIE